MDFAHAEGRHFDVGLALIVVVVVVVTIGGCVVFVAVVAAAARGVCVEAGGREDGDFGRGAHTGRGLRVRGQTHADGALAADGLDQVEGGVGVGAELVVDGRERGRVDEDERVGGVDEGGADGDLSFRDAGRGDRDVVLAEPGREELARHAAGWVFERHLDARSRACVAADAVVAFC